jgi:hypothetical protein
MTTSQNEIVSQVKYFKPREKTDKSVFTSTVRKPWQYDTREDITKNAKVRFTRDGLCLVTCFDKSRYREKGYEELEHFYDGHTPTPKPKTNLLKKIINPDGTITFIENDNLKQDKPKRTPTEQEKNKRDALIRAKKKVFEIASANEWSYMVTFTLNKEKIDRYDPKTVQKSFSAWLSNMVQRKDLKALIIPEYHPTDKAIHFHGLINDTLTFDHSNTYKVMGKKKPMREERVKRLKKTIHDDDVKPVYNIKEYKLGFSTAIPLDEQLQKEETSKNVTRVSHYITKYCTKDLDKIFGSYYIAVGKIERELPFILCNMDFEQLAEFGKVVKLPENYGTVCYATITKDDFQGSEIL